MPALTSKLKEQLEHPKARFVFATGSWQGALEGLVQFWRWESLERTWWWAEWFFKPVIRCASGIKEERLWEMGPEVLAGGHDLTLVVEIRWLDEATPGAEWLREVIPPLGAELRFVKTPRQKVDEWNAKWPVGTRVRLRSSGRELVTTSQAWLYSGAPAVTVNAPVNMMLLKSIEPVGEVAASPEGMAAKRLSRKAREMN